ncbi:MAG TPA: CTP synthase, partial [Acidimicrobiales bacterium]|nr:CTP synthase [Acidimicrobiales bacterium]
GTVGDIEIVPFLEAIRQFRHDVGRDNVCYVHLTLVPYLAPSGEQKTKPTQHSVTELRGRGIQPDVIVCRSDQPISDGLKRKISLLCDVPHQGVISAVDASSIYEIPLVLHDEGFDRVVCKMLAIDDALHPVDLSNWERVVSQVSAAERPVRIGVVGKYINLPDAYLSVVEALRHAGFHHGAKVEVDWIQAEEVPDLLGTERLHQLDGMVIPGGFGERGIEGKVTAARFSREHEVPCLGLCLGLQVMVIDAARHMAGMEKANSREFDSLTPYAVIDLMDDQQNIVEKGGTMRLGAYVAQLLPGSQVAEAYGAEVVAERHRHRYEVNPRYRARLEESGLVCSGVEAKSGLVEFIELPGHPFWLGTQAHPEFKSRPDRAHPLFRELVAAALARAEGRLPRLLDIDADVGAVS